MSRFSVTQARLDARRQRQAKLAKPFYLNLASMVDMFTILLVFLLVAYTVSDDAYSVPKSIDLPTSTSHNLATTSVKLAVSPDAIVLDDKTIVTLQGGELRPQDVQGMVIVPLYLALEAVYPKEVSAADGQTQQPAPAKAIVNLYSDRRVPYGTIKRIMFTAGQAKYEGFHFSAIRRSVKE